MSKRNEKKSRHLGTFTVQPDEKLLGELRIDGSKTSLRLLHSNLISPVQEATTVYGELQTLEKVTCLQCVPNGSGSTSGKDGRQSHYANLFPHFVAIGDQHFDPEDRCIEAVYFTVDDIGSIFYDFDAFGYVIDSKPLINTVATANKLERRISIGDQPIIAYFAGQCEVIAIDTTIGAFKVRHVPSYSMGGPTGVFIKNRMTITVEPASPIDFGDCIERLQVFLRFLSAVAGRGQAPREIHLKLSDQSDERMRPLRLHWSYRPQGSKGNNSSNETHPMDLPLDAIRRPDEFTAVLQHWVARDPSWRLARVRYAGCMQDANFYGVNRLVTAANMFDLLPEDAVPMSSTLSPELEKAQKDCLTIFKAQEHGVERDSVIGALKRMNQPSLPKKVLHRVAIVDRALGHQFPELALVAKTAVKVRNHFVHGESGSFDYGAVEQSTSFFTDALEFIFYASDLIEAGWNANVWFQGAHGWGHPLARFRSDYLQALMNFKSATAAPATE